MKIRTPEQVKNGLIARGTLLNPGRDMSQFSGLIDPSYIDMYSIFDGFPKYKYDDANAIRILPFGEILDGVKTKVIMGRLAFADFLMGSDSYTFDIENCESEIKFEINSSIVSDSYMSFWNEYLEGKYDFL